MATPQKATPLRKSKPNQAKAIHLVSFYLSERPTLHRNDATAAPAPSALFWLSEDRRWGDPENGRSHLPLLAPSAFVFDQ